MEFLRCFVASALLFVTLSMPLSASAANVFGGKVGVAFPCFNIAIWTTVGGPRGGLYIWTPATKTYPNGHPAPGKYVLGLYGIPYFCITLIAPLYVLPGISITMMGSSGGGAPLTPMGSAPAPAPTPAPTPTPPRPLCTDTLTTNCTQPLCTSRTPSTTPCINPTVEIP